MDFTLSKYKSLLKTLQDKGYKFITFYDYLSQDQSINRAYFASSPQGNQHAKVGQSTNLPKGKQVNQSPDGNRDNHSINLNLELETPNLKRLIILRHDVDLKPQNSLATAKIEQSLGISSSYYFRAVPESWDEGIIRAIAALGHEVGYHYENLTICNGNIEAAYKNFKENLQKLRQLVEVKTICMHGSPRSKYDNREIWRMYSYRDQGIIGEPYFDIDFNEVFYLTDTGRRWDGHRVSIRDKVAQQDKWSKQGLVFRTTQDIIQIAQQGTLPNLIMITVHPQRWTNSILPWIKELVWQKAKNMVKGMIVRSKQ
jgi:hypothetical protein